MKFSVLVVTAITTAQHLDIRSCVCSSAKGSCDCDDAVKTVQVLSDAIPSCTASRGWQNIEEQPYADNSCGHARLFADVVCTKDDDTEAYPHDPCGAAHRFAVRECSLEKRSQDEFYATDACTTGQKRAADCLRRRGQFPGLPGTWVRMASLTIRVAVDVAPRSAAPKILSLVISVAVADAPKRETRIFLARLMSVAVVDAPKRASLSFCVVPPSAWRARASTASLTMSAAPCRAARRNASWRRAGRDFPGTFVVVTKTAPPRRSAIWAMRSR
ncbi:hypothetical protein NLG97_g5182 [Lecanicillium saksenae]|uniref:Uncharacterized protein n=1 Tax=Lecanicillium saksenae TaxID=468837 RepID=A0ACC1QVN1_9HYPO|nr:hypothetical protein NLG97_g5182 [Lecanicillium saksenae]